MNAGANARPVVIVVRLGLALLLLALGAGIYHFACRNHASSCASPDADESPSGQGDSIRSAVESILRAQEAAWNRSDIDAFMEHYWKSDARNVQLRRQDNPRLDRNAESLPRALSDTGQNGSS